VKSGYSLLFSFLSSVYLAFESLYSCPSVNISLKYPDTTIYSSKRYLHVIFLVENLVRLLFRCSR